MKDIIKVDSSDIKEKMESLPYIILVEGPKKGIIIPSPSLAVWSKDEVRRDGLKAYKKR